MIKFGVIGTNFISDKFADAVSKNDNCRIEAVYSRYQQHADSACKKWNLNKTYLDIDEMLKDKNIDAVYVASPNLFHFNQGKKVLLSGKHLLVEKPATVTADEFSELCKIAEENNLVVLEGMRCHFAPCYQDFSRYISKIGKVRRAILTYCQYSSRYDKFKSGIIENAFNPKLCNGSLMDIGVYPIALMTMLFGKPKSLTSSGNFLPNSIDCYGTVLALYPEMQVIINYSKVNNSYIPSEIQGEKGCISFNPLAVPDKIIVTMNDGKSETFSFDNKGNDMYYEVEKFIQCTQNPVICKKYNDITLSTIEIMEQIRNQIGINFK